MNHWLAQAAGADPLISGQWLIGIVGAIASGAALIIGKIQGRREAQASDVTLRRPVPTIETREKPAWALKSDLEALAAKHDRNIHNVHARLDDQVKALARLEGTAASTSENVGKLLDIAMNRKQPPRA